MFVAKTYKTEIASKINGWRLWGFRVLAALLTLAMVAASGVELFASLIQHEGSSLVHLWHQGELLAIAVLLGGAMLALMHRSQKKPLLAQFTALSLAITSISVGFFEIKALALLAVVALFIALYPRTRALLSFSRESSVSIPVLGLSILMSFVFAPIAQKEVYFQIIGMPAHDAHAELFHWIGSAVLMALLVLGGVMSATKVAGWKQLGIITGVTYVYIGALAMALQDNYAGSWSGGIGLLAVIAGIWYILFTVLEAQRTKAEKVVPAAVVEPRVDFEALPAMDTLPRRETRELVGAH